MFSILKGYEGYHFNEMSGNWDFIKEDSWVFAKVFSKNREGKVISAPAMLPSKFTLAKEVSPTNLTEAFDLIKELSKVPSLVAIRAKKNDILEPFKRNRVNFSSTTGSKIVALDIDSVPLPRELSDSLDIHKWMEYIIDCFVQINPEVFSEDMGYIAHASSSAGLKKGVRMHVLLESNINVTQSQLKYFFNELNSKAKIMFQFEIADLNYYSATQPHFFSDPIFTNGIKDPFEGKPRLVMREGDVCSFPENMPEFITKKAEVVKKDFEFYNLINGKKSFPKEVAAALEELEKAEDGVYLRVIPKVYHKAWQNGVNIPWIEQYMTTILESYIKYSDRSDRSVQQYLDNGRAEALKAFLGESRRLVPGQVDGVRVEMLETSSQEDEVYLKMFDLPPKKTVTFVKASLGTGKTTAVSNWIKAGIVSGNFLAITNTRSLVASNAEKFNAGQYSNSMDVMEFFGNSLSRMSTTIHSLHKFTAKANSINFLFIDECDAVMNDILFSPIIKNRKEIIETLQTIMYNADHIILSDGDISEETISAYGALIDYSRPINAVDHKRAMLSNVSAVEFCDEDSVWSAFKSCLDIGEKCILVSDCSPDDLNEKGLILRNLTGKVIKEIHSSSTSDDDIRRILDYTNDELRLQNIDGLLCSPSVTSGVDFNYFDNVFVLTLSNNHTPNLRFQALRRDRGARHIFYYTAPTTRGFVAGSEQFNPGSDWFETCQQRFAKRREIESMHFQNTFRYYLMDQGCFIDIIQEEWGKLESVDEDSYLAQRVNAILQSSMNYTPQRHNDAYSVKQNIVYYYGLESTAEVTFEIIEKFLNERPDKAAEFFHKLYPVFWPIIKQCTKGFHLFIEAIKEKQKEFFLATGSSANSRFFKIYLKKAGILEPGEYDNVISWYKLYCSANNLEIPDEFLSETELELRIHASLELV